MYIDTGILTMFLEHDLAASGWDGSLEPYPGQSKKQFELMALRRSLVKKYLPGTPKSGGLQAKRALDLFLEVNNRCSTYNPASQLRSEAEEIMWGEAKAFLYDFFYPRPRETWQWLTPYAEMQKVCLFRDYILRPSSFMEGCGVGPGASVGSLSSDFFTKLGTSRLTMTDPALYSSYVQTIFFHPTWSGLEMSRHKTKGIKIVPGSRLSYVPKSAEICRTICTEPILNMFFQKAIQFQLEKRLKEVTNIDLSTQPGKNAKLAQRGSKTQRFGTIDLKSASDSLSITLLSDLLPPEVMKTLMKYRSPVTTIPSGEQVELHMVSSMGNAYTFPLQTILFTALVVGVYRVMGLIPRVSRGRSVGDSTFAVFGDDIIVLREAYSCVTRMLELSGFTVNHDKSYNIGPFRESCGQDFLNGHPVRGVYIQALSDRCDVYSAINRLNRWSAKHHIALNHLVSYLMSKVRFLPVPYDVEDTAGVKVPLWMLESIVRVPNKGGIKYTYAKILDRRVPISENARGDGGCLGWYFNPDGLLLSFIGGYIRGGFISLRANARKAVNRVGYTPRWDYIPLDQDETPAFREAWERFVAINLM